MSQRRGLSVGMWILIALGATLLACGLSGALSCVFCASAFDQAARQVRQQEAQQAAAEAASRDALRGEAPERLERARQSLAEGRGRAEAKEFATAEEYATRARTELDPLAALQPPVDGVTEALDQIAAFEAEVQPHVVALGALDSARSALEADYPDAVAEQDAYRHALEQLDAIPEVVRDDYRREARQLRQQLSRKERAVEAAAERLREERVQAQTREILCGTETPTVGRHVLGLYLRQSANDPDSIEVSDCSAPRLTVDCCWLMTCTVRGANAFGGRVAQQWEFEIGRDNRVLGGNAL